MMKDNLRQHIVKVLLIAIILFLPVYYLRFSVFSFPTNPIEVAVVIAWLLSLCSPSVRGAIPRKVTYAVVLILLGISIGVIVAADHRSAFGILKGWFILPAIFGATLWRVADESTIEKIKVGVAVNVTAVSLYAILQRAGIMPLIGYQRDSAEFSQYLQQGRAFAIFESPNFLAMYLVPLTVLAAASVWERTKTFILTATFLILPLIAIYLSSSRGGLLALLAGAIVLMAWKSYRKLAIVLLVSLSVSGFVYFALIPKVGTGDEARLYIYQQSIALIKNHPITGVGPGQFQAALDSRVGGDEYYQQFVRPYAIHPHDIFLNYWLSGGILALTGFVWLIWMSLRMSWHSATMSTRAAVGALLAILVHGLFDSSYFKNDLAIIFYLVIFLLLISSADTNGYNS